MFKHVVKQTFLKKSTFCKILLPQRENYQKAHKRSRICWTARENVRKTVWIAKPLTCITYIVYIQNKYCQAKLQNLPIYQHQKWKHLRHFPSDEQDNLAFTKYSYEVIFFVTCTGCDCRAYAIFSPLFAHLKFHVHTEKKSSNSWNMT